MPLVLVSAQLTLQAEVGGCGNQSTAEACVLTGPASSTVFWGLYANPSKFHCCENHADKR